MMDDLDTGFTSNAASEIKTKISSRQRVQIHAGRTEADFHEEDEVGFRCKEINDAAIQWALSKASAKALSNYNTYGEKLVTGDDLGPFNTGPTWIWTLMSYDENSDHTVCTVSSPMMRTPEDFYIPLS